MLVERFIQAKGTGDDKEIRATIDRAINSSPSLRNKKDLIEQFVDSVSASAKVDAQWQAFMAAKKAEELERIIAVESLNAEDPQLHRQRFSRWKHPFHRHRPHQNPAELGRASCRESVC